MLNLRNFSLVVNVFAENLIFLNLISNIFEHCCWC